MQTRSCGGRRAPCAAAIVRSDGAGMSRGCRGVAILPRLGTAMPRRRGGIGAGRRGERPAYVVVPQCRGVAVPQCLAGAKAGRAGQAP
eukprot:4217853-Pyramimonas_sp.AAC.1